MLNFSFLLQAKKKCLYSMNATYCFYEDQEKVYFGHDCYSCCVFSQCEASVSRKGLIKQLNLIARNKYIIHLLRFKKKKKKRFLYWSDQFEQFNVGTVYYVVIHNLRFFVIGYFLFVCLISNGLLSSDSCLGYTSSSTKLNTSPIGISRVPALHLNALLYHSTVF